MRKFNLVLIAITSLFLTGCPPKSASLLIREDNSKYQDEEWAYITSKEGNFYQINSKFVVESLQKRLTHPIIATIRIELLGGERLKSKQVELSRDSLFYQDNTGLKAIHLDEVAKITIVDKYTTEDFLYATGYSALTGTALAVVPVSSRSSFNEAVKSSLIGAGIGVVVGNLLAYRSKKVVEAQTIFINGVHEYINWKTWEHELNN